MTATAPAPLEPSAHPTAAPCTQCGAALQTPFCGQCGHKRFERHDFALGHFLHHAFHELFHLDGRLWRTLRDLVYRPGLPAAEALAGRGGRYLGPLRIFLVLSAVYYFVGGTGAARMETMLEYGATRTGARETGGFAPHFERLAARHHESVEAYKLHAEAQFQSAVKLARVGSVVLFTLLLAALLVRRGHYLGEHATLALHFYGFAFIVSTLVQPFVFAERLHWGWSLGLGTVLMAVWLARALRRVYALGAWGAVWRTGVLMLGNFALTFVGYWVAFAYVLR